MQLSREGLVPGWLVSPIIRGELELQTLRTPRHGAAVAKNLKPWQVFLPDAKLIDLRSHLNGARTGTIWASVNVNSLTGGRRLVAAHSFCKMTLYLDGKPVLNKPAPNGYEGDSKTVVLELPKGEATLLVALEIRFGHASFALQLLDAEKQRPLSGDTIRLYAAAAEQTVAGAEALPNAGQAFCKLLQLRTNKAFAVPDEEIELYVRLESGAPPLSTISAKLLNPDGTSLFELPARTLEELQSGGWQARFKAKTGKDASILYQLVLLSDGAELGRRKIPLYTQAGLDGEIANLTQDAAILPASNGNAHAQLSLAQANLWLKHLPFTITHQQGELGARVVALLEQARSALQAARENKNYYEGRSGYFERAYISAIDGSPQPYFVMVPSAYRDHPDRKFPLVLFLHGYVPDYHLHKWWTEFSEFNELFERNHAFLAIPFARSNTDFLGPGAVDVLDVLEIMQKEYPIDAERVSLFGYSMGGLGVSTLASHYPDKWSAAIVLSGRADSPMLMGTRGLETLHPIKQHLIKCDTPIELFENKLHIPIRIYHGKYDSIVPPEQGERLYRRLKASSCEVELELYDGDHMGGLKYLSDEDSIRWLIGKRRTQDPEVLRLKHYSLRYMQAYGLRAIHGSGGLKPFLLSQTPAELLVENITSFETKAGTAAAKRQIPETFKSGNPAGFYSQNVLSRNSRWKTPERCGPVKEALCAPFLLVYGSVGGESVEQRLKAQAEQFAQEWYDFAKGAARIKADREVTPEERRSMNLFLFGEAQENAIFDEFEAELPIGVRDGTVTINNRTYTLKDRGLLYIYPSPQMDAAAYCSIVIVAGERYGTFLPINHKLDLVPDFLLFSTARDSDGTNTNQPIVAGFFDGTWAFDPETIWDFSP